MSVRTVLAALLTGRLAESEYQIIPAADDPDNIGKRTVVMLWQDAVSRFEQIGHDHLKVTVTLWILTGHEDPENAERSLEDGLDAVIEALRTLEWISWERADRLTFGDPPKYHGYKLTLTALGQIGG